MAKVVRGALATYLTVLLIGMILGGVSVWLVYDPQVLDLKAKNRLLENRLQELNSTAIYTRQRLRELEIQKKNLERVISNLTQALEEKDSVISELRKVVDSLGKEVGRLQSELKERRECPLTVKMLPDREYYVWVRDIIRRANSSIHLAVFLLKYDPRESVYNDPVNMLLLELVEAKRRGVDVKVVVDDATYNEYRETIDYLKSKGIPVRLDPSETTLLHAKILIVDGEWVFVGSHNWSESALSFNREYSVLIRSTNYAAEAEKYFENLWQNGRHV